MMIEESDLPNIERLRWQCRRGMLELDVLLEAFLEQRYTELPPRLKHLFIQLLAFPDPVIHTWCVAGESPEDEAFGELVSVIRETSVA